MKVVILAGGLGTRLAEETEVRPKPMVEVGGRPILWHIMKQYAQHGFNEFYIALGYKGEQIKRYFLDYGALAGSFTLHLGTGTVEVRQAPAEDWTVHLIDTGQDTATGGRIRRLRPHLGDAPFMATYGDGLSDIDLRSLAHFHRSRDRIATVTAVRPPSRFGGLVLNGSDVHEFTEKPQIHEGWINGGFMVLNPGIFDYLDDDASTLERDGLERVAAAGQLSAYRHDGFWQCMDTLRDKKLLESLWQDGNAPWQSPKATS
jgi:glucose-1-phosphate cytidylyltransferase